MRTWHAALTSIVVILTLASVHPTEAETARKRLSAQRFMIPGQEDLTGAQEVVVKTVTFSDLPDEMKEMITAVLDQCVKGGASPDEPTYYSYESSRTRKARSLPNILVDYRPLAGKTFKRCSQPSALLCEGPSCQLAGYAHRPGDGTWKQAFALSPERWSFELQNAEANKPSQGEAYLSIVSKMPLCEEQGGSLTDGDCLQRFVWRGDSLTPVDLASQTGH